MNNFNENKNFNKRAVELLFFKYLKLITIVFIAIIFILSYFIVLKPRYEKMKNHSGVIINEKENELKVFEKYLGELKDFNESYEKISSSDMENMNKVIPNKNDYEDLVVVVNDIVSNRGLELSSVSVGNVASKYPPSTRVKTTKAVASENNSFKNKIKKIDLSLDISGVIDYKKMKILVSDFERSQRLFDINSIDFTDNSDRMSLGISAYYFDTEI